MLGAGFQLGFALLLARMYGVDGYGIYTLVLSLILISVTIGVVAKSNWPPDKNHSRIFSLFGLVSS